MSVDYPSYLRGFTMNVRLPIGSVVIAVMLSSHAAIAAPLLTESSRLGTNGIGPVQVGMTIAQAEAKSGRRFVAEVPGRGGCGYAVVKGLGGVNFMVINGVIERVDISNPKVMTLSGAKIGDSEGRVKTIYPDQIKTEIHPYTGRSGGKYLIFQPQDRADRNYRVIFETTNGKVVRFRAGRLPAVDYIEGCS
jgi:hypothetical protein